MSTDSLEPRVYEVGYHVLPIVGESDLDAEVNLIREAITKNGGELIKEGSPRLIDLAYPMSKIIENKRNEFSKGYFGWIKFAIAPEMTFVIKKILDEHPKLLRFIMISTVREDTIVGDIEPSVAEDKKEENPKEAEDVKPEEVAEVESEKGIDDPVSEE